MKTRVVKSFIALVAVGLSVLGPSRVVAQNLGDPVTIGSEGILIPGTNISEKDQQALTAILARYNKSLYTIKGYVNGKPNKPLGTLPASEVDSATAARAAVHAKDKHFTGWTLQVASSSNQQFVHRINPLGNTSNQSKPGNTSNQSKPGNTSNQSKPGNTSNQDIPKTAADASKTKELVKRLTPILQKYTKGQTAR
jgi:hypothetical protein